MSDRSSLKTVTFQIAGSFSGSNKDWAATKGAAYSAAQTNNIQWLLLYGGAAFKGCQLTGDDELKTHANCLKHRGLRDHSQLHHVAHQFENQGR